MKTIPFINKLTNACTIALVTVAVGCGQAPNSQDSADASKMEALEKQNELLKASLKKRQEDLDEARADNLGSTTVVAAGPSADEILDELTNLKMTSANKKAMQRRISFLLESLKERGDASVPVIRDYLNKMEDVEFAVERSEEEGREERGRGRGGDWMERMRSRSRGTSLNFDQPPSLRIGLIDVLKEIGGRSAQAALGEVLESTARGFEVAYVSKTVREMMGDDAFKKEAIAAAHDLLTNPVEIPNPNSFDRNNKRFLFNVLEMYNDQTFIESAQRMLVTDDGKIDDTVLDYLDDVGKEQAISSIFQAFNSGNVTDRGDLADLARAGIKYTGSNPQANQMFNDIMSSDDYDMRVKWSALREMDDVDDNDTLRARLQLMQNIPSSGNDGQDKIVQMYSRQIEAKINGEEYNMRDDMRNLGGDFWRNAFGDMGRGRDRGGDRDRGGERRNQPTVVPAP